MHKAFLLLGSNLNEPETQLKTALGLIKQHIGSVKEKSSIYRTAAWGLTNQPDFLNQVLEIETDLSPEVTLENILKIEKEMGRERTIRNAPREIDIDILFFSNLVIDKPRLTIPHPAIAQRKFVLVPMNQIAPQLLHPVFNKTISELLTICSDKLDVSKM